LNPPHLLGSGEGEQELSQIVHPMHPISINNSHIIIDYNNQQTVVNMDGRCDQLKLHKVDTLHAAIGGSFHSSSAASGLLDENAKMPHDGVPAVCVSNRLISSSLNNQIYVTDGLESVGNGDQGPILC